MVSLRLAMSMVDVGMEKTVKFLDPDLHKTLTDVTNIKCCGLDVQSDGDSSQVYFVYHACNHLLFGCLSTCKISSVGLTFHFIR